MRVGVDMQKGERRTSDVLLGKVDDNSGGHEKRKDRTSDHSVKNHGQNERRAFWNMEGVLAQIVLSFRHMGLGIGQTE